MCKKYLTKPREIRDTERIKRGCHYCADRIPQSKAKGKTSKCPYEECPYHELDEVKNYDEYLQKTDKNGLAKILEMLGE